jgi:hypothetical protein
VLAAVHNATAISIPNRKPTESSNEPHNGLPSMYAYEKAEIALVYAFADSPVSRKIVGARTASTCRSIYDSSVASMIVVGATHLTSVDRCGSGSALEGFVNGDVPNPDVRSILSVPVRVTDTGSRREDRARE